jgi:hypothetical protein
MKLNTLASLRAPARSSLSLKKSPISAKVAFGDGNIAFVVIDSIPKNTTLRAVLRKKFKNAHRAECERGNQTAVFSY